jgi:hypothetical protein
MKIRIRQQLRALIPLFAVMAMVACSESENPQAADTTPVPADPGAVARAQEYACTLLTKEEIQAVQGEAPVETKGTRQTEKGLSVSQCYFQLPQAVNSIVLTVMQKAEGTADARDPSKNWEGIFHREGTTEKREEEGEKEPEKVEGIGDEAFWTGTRVGGALYVLKGNTYVRISVGGAGDQADKINKSKALAQHILGRMVSFNAATTH